MSTFPRSARRAQAAIAVLLTLWSAPAGCAAELILVRAGDPILFKVVSKAKVLSCTGKFTGTDGNFDGPFASSVRVKFGAAAEGRVNPCTITMTTAGPAGQPPRTETTTVLVVTPAMRSRTLAHVAGSSDDRTTLGVGEEVMFTAQPREMLLDSDVSWIVRQPWDTIAPRTGLGAIYQAGFPSPGQRNHRNTAEGTSDGGVSLNIRYCTDDVMLYFGGASAGNHDAGASTPYPAFARRHETSALVAAYRSKLNAAEATLDAHRWSFEPVLVKSESPARFYRSSRDFFHALVALATLMTHAPGDPSGDQPPDMKNQEVRIVSKIVAGCYRAVDPKFNPDFEHAPQDRDVRPPEGYRLRKEIHVVIDGYIRPEDIVQPELRREFRRRIAAQNRKIAWFNKQYWASFNEETMQRFAYAYLQELCGRSDPRLEQFQCELVALGIDAATARKLAKKPAD